MEVFYESSDQKQKIKFDGNEYGIADHDLYQHEYKYTTTENEKIKEFSKGIINRKIEVNITSNKEKSWKELYDEMNGVFTKDVILNKPGKIYVNGSYMHCFIYASTPAEVFDDVGFQTTELKVVTDDATWITEQKISISPIGEVSTETEDGIKKYPYSYPYKYPLLQTETRAYIDHYTESDFKLTAFGPAESILIRIAGNIYEVKYSIKKGEYLIIDSRKSSEKERRLYVVHENGDIESVFNYRSTEHSVFKKIPSGLIEIDYSRLYGVDLTIFKERNEPLWSLLK